MGGLRRIPVWLKVSLALALPVAALSIGVRFGDDPSTVEVEGSPTIDNLAMITFFGVYVFVVAAVIRGARRSGRNPWGWGVLAVVTGSIGYAIWVLVRGNQPREVPVREVNASSVTGAPTWFRRCPVCKEAALIYQPMKVLTGPRGTCPKCQAAFKRKSTLNWMLSKEPETSLPTWQLYQGQALQDHEWMNIANGGQSDLLQQHSDIEAWMDGVASRPSPLLFAGSSGVQLKEREQVLASFPQISLSEIRSESSYEGGSQGMSFRLAKGVSYRVGGHRGRTVSREVLKTIDFGAFVVTSERVVFLGDKRSANIPMKKVVGFNVQGNDTITVAKDGREKLQHFSGFHFYKVPISVQGRNWQAPIATYILAALVAKHTRRGGVGGQTVVENHPPVPTPMDVTED